jgi:PKD repeat protein
VHSPASPVASFAWFPSKPRTGESVSLVSSSTDTASPITAFAWDLKGIGAFVTGGPGMSTTFSKAGKHIVQLRVTGANGLSTVAAETILVSSRPLTLMQPFPIVRITSTRTQSGIKLKLLSVLAPAGAQITVRCEGRACPLKSQSHVASGKARAAFVEFRRFERSLAAGVTLEIRVSKAGEIGKYTRFVVRRGGLPVRLDACLAGARVKPVVCPSS